MKQAVCTSTRHDNDGNNVWVKRLTCFYFTLAETVEFYSIFSTDLPIIFQLLQVIRFERFKSLLESGRIVL